MDKNSINGKFNVKDAYIVATSKIVRGYANEENFVFARDGKDLFLFNSKLWLEIPKQLSIEFFKTVANKLGIPEHIASSVSFVNKLHKQLMQDAYFPKATTNENLYVNLENGVLAISHNGMRLEAHHPKYFTRHLIHTTYESSQTYFDYKPLSLIIPSQDTQKTLQQAIAQVFVKGLNDQKKICLYGMQEEQLGLFIDSVKDVIPPEFIVEDLFVNYKKIKEEPSDLETLIVIPCNPDIKFLGLEDSQSLFNWLIRGVKELTKNKYVHISNECKEFRNRFNTVRLFVNETSLVKTEKNAKSIVTSYQEVLNQYELFCELHDEKPLGRGKFNKELKALGFESTRRESGNVWFAKFE
jgi:hypothetical protein